MDVFKTNLTSRVQSSKLYRKKRKSAEAVFSEHVESPKPTQHAGSPFAVDSVDALLVLQEGATAHEERKKTTKKCEELIDGLESIRLALLVGEISEARLDHILDLVNQRKASNLDDKIGKLLEDIELRVKVELAKLGKFA